VAIQANDVNFENSSFSTYNSFSKTHFAIRFNLRQSLSNRTLFCVSCFLFSVVSSYVFLNSVANFVSLKLAKISVTTTSCLSYPGGLGASDILGDLDHSKYLGKLITYLYPALPSASRSYFSRCWHAKTDGWDASIFHSNCDGKGPTVTIVKVGQYIFGGYTDTSWQSTYILINIIQCIFFLVIGQEPTT